MLYKKINILLHLSPRLISLHATWQNQTARWGLSGEWAHTVHQALTFSSPLYQRILQFQALSSLRQQGTDVRKFALRFSGAAESLGYNDAALKDLFKSALEEPLNWRRMRGLEHLTFGQFVEFLEAVAEPDPVREPRESAPEPAPEPLHPGGLLLCWPRPGLLLCRHHPGILVHLCLQALCLCMGTIPPLIRLWPTPS